MIEIKRTDIESLGKMFEVEYVENKMERKKIFYIYTYERVMSIKWKGQIIHIQTLNLDCNFKMDNGRTSELPVDEIRNRIKTVDGMSKDEFALYCLDMLKLYHEIVELIGEYKIGRSDDEWSKHTKVYIDSPYSSIQIDSVQGSMSGCSPQISSSQNLYFEKLHIK
ncbi:hypothetical protein [Peribacillus aracenensis]|uniref:hypothetical protein n=1 Tax=Peribacillus aracenensis TaxID=2976708 RepID=UPI0021A40264|nr:hypothetical protein [Peribacillus sp. BBB004]